MIGTIIIFILVLALLVLVHELGHFLTAKKMGMKIHEFGIGFPPKIWSKKGKDGVIYSLNWIPLGGYVNLQEDEGESDDPDSFVNKKIWQRAIVISSGVIMNFLLCAFLLTIGFLIGLPQAVDQESLEQGLVKDYKIQIVSVVDDKPAKAAGIQIGDVLLKVDDDEIKSVNELREYTADRVGQNVNYTFLRAEEEITSEIEIVEIEPGRGGIGVGLIESGIVAYPVHLAVYNGFKLTGILTKVIVFAFANIFKNLVVGQPVGVQVSGPVGIAVLTGQVAQLGFIYILQFTALLSLNLAIINFVPFPALDGGRFVFLIIEKIRRKPVSKKVEGFIHSIGFTLLILLIIVVTFQDILRYVDFSFFSKIFQ